MSGDPMLTPEEENALVADIEEMLLSYPEDKYPEDQYEAMTPKWQPKDKYPPGSLGDRVRWRGL